MADSKVEKGSKLKKAPKLKKTPKLTSEWPDVIRKHVEQQNRVCRFVFRNSRFKQGLDGEFWACSGNCKHGHNDDRRMKCWKIQIRGKKPSSKATHIQFSVK